MGCAAGKAAQARERLVRGFGEFGKFRIINVKCVDGVVYFCAGIGVVDVEIFCVIEIFEVGVGRDIKKHVIVVAGMNGCAEFDLRKVSREICFNKF